MYFALQKIIKKNCIFFKEANFKLGWTTGGSIEII